MKFFRWLQKRLHLWTCSRSQFKWRDLFTEFASCSFQSQRSVRLCMHGLSRFGRSCRQKKRMIFLNLFSSQRLARNFPNSTKWNFLTRFLLLESLDVVVRSVPLLSVVAFFFFFCFLFLMFFPRMLVWTFSWIGRIVFEQYCQHAHLRFESFLRSFCVILSLVGSCKQYSRSGKASNWPK